MFPNRKQGFVQRPQQPRIKKEEKCRVVIKKKKDGSVVKEVSGACTKSQLSALHGNDDSEGED